MKGDWLFKYPSSFCFRLANLPPNVFISCKHVPCTMASKFCMILMVPS